MNWQKKLSTETQFFSERELVVQVSGGRRVQGPRPNPTGCAIVQTVNIQMVTRKRTEMCGSLCNTFVWKCQQRNEPDIPQLACR